MVFYQILVYLVKHHNMGHLDGDHYEFAGQVKDDWDSSVDIPTDNQKKTIDALVKTLIKSFPIKQLGGHRSLFL